MATALANRHISNFDREVTDLTVAIEAPSSPEGFASDRAMRQRTLPRKKCVCNKSCRAGYAHGRLAEGVRAVRARTEMDIVNKLIINKLRRTLIGSIGPLRWPHVALEKAIFSRVLHSSDQREYYERGIDPAGAGA